MTCREASNLLPLFLDGELDPRQMRVVAMHSMRCQSCELELKEMERLQLLVSDTVKMRVNEIDFSQLWSNVDKRIAHVHVSWLSRLRLRWEEIDLGFDFRMPAMVVATAIAVMALAWYARQPNANQPPDVQTVARRDYTDAAEIENLETTFPKVSVHNDRENEATILWVQDEGPLLETIE